MNLEKRLWWAPTKPERPPSFKPYNRFCSPEDVKGFDPLRDYPRALYNDISTGKANPANVPVATATFELDEADRLLLPDDLQGCQYRFTRNLDNSSNHQLLGAPDRPVWCDIKDDLNRLVAHVAPRVPQPVEGEPSNPSPAQSLADIASTWDDNRVISGEGQTFSVRGSTVSSSMSKKKTQRRSNATKKFESSLALPITLQSWSRLSEVIHRLNV